MGAGDFLNVTSFLLMFFSDFVSSIFSLFEILCFFFFGMVRKEADLLEKE